MNDIYPLDSFSREEVRGFTNHINEELQSDASLRGALPMNPESTDLFKVNMIFRSLSFCLPLMAGGGLSFVF